ncbi:pyridoxal phosphate-dependent aminotransferase [Bacteroidales bacterium]|nr:pyridoxal phosphate-dependent aminotransferase [Bacteroidales bacterium]
MEILSTRVSQMAPSATMAMNQRTRDLKAKGVDVINLSVGEPDFPTPDNIKKAAIDAINNNFTYYPPATGFQDLREAIVEKFKRENNLDYKVSQTLITVGAKNALAYAILALVDKGDEVIVPEPYWVTYAELVKLAEGKNVFLPSTYKTDFKVSPEEIEAAITPKTKAILLCSPSNPSGAVYSEEEIRAIGKIVEKHPRIFVITDEIYEHINFVGEHFSMANIDSIKDRTVVINGVSKSYAMTGWRIGYMAATEEIIKACTKLQGQILTGPTTIAMKAATEALNADQGFIKEMLEVFRTRRDLVIARLNEIDDMQFNIPEGAFYVFPNIKSYFGKTDGKRTVNTAEEFCIYLLEEAHVGTVPGEAFGNPDCFRISYASSEEILNEAMDRIKVAVNKLK